MVWSWLKTQKPWRWNFLTWGLPFKLECIADKMKPDHGLTVDEPGNQFEIVKNFLTRKNLARGMTPKSFNDVIYLEPRQRYSHQSRSQTRCQTDPHDKESLQFIKFCKNWSKDDHSTLRCFKRESNNYRPVKFVTLNLDKKLVINLNLPQRKLKENFWSFLSRIIKVYQTNVLLILMFLHINHISVLPHNQLFEVKVLLQEKDLLQKMLKLGLHISLLTIVLNL